MRALLSSGERSAAVAEHGHDFRADLPRWRLAWSINYAGVITGWCMAALFYRLAEALAKEAFTVFPSMYRGWTARRS